MQPVPSPSAMLLIKVLCLRNQDFPPLHCGWEAPQVSVPRTFTRSSPPAAAAVLAAAILVSALTHEKGRSRLQHGGPTHQGDQPLTSLLLPSVHRQVCRFSFL